MVVKIKIIASVSHTIGVKSAGSASIGFAAWTMPTIAHTAAREPEVNANPPIG